MEALRPGATDLILTDFLAQRQHGREMSKEAIAIDRENLTRFTIFQFFQVSVAALLALAFGAGGITLIATGNSITGFVLLLVEIGVLAGVFMNRERKSPGHDLDLRDEDGAEDR